jgi:hypothetical protein
LDVVFPGFKDPLATLKRRIGLCYYKHIYFNKSINIPYISNNNTNKNESINQSKQQFIKLPTEFGKILKGII